MALPPRRRHRRIPNPWAALFFSLCIGLLFFAGCKQAFKIEDPQLKPIEEMLQKYVPIGTTEASVNEFLSSRGYPTESSSKPGTIVAVIRHIDTQRLQPVTVRVTFYFDANGKLNTYEMVRTVNAPIPQ